MTNNKQQTVVDWLVKQFENHRATFFKLNDKEERVITLAGRDVVEQAKEMEKEKQKYFFDCGRQYQLTGEGTFNEVYNETYKGNKWKFISIKLQKYLWVKMTTTTCQHEKRMKWYCTI